MTLVYPAGDFEAFLTAVLETWVHRAPEWTIEAEGEQGWGLGGETGPRRVLVADAQAAQRMAVGIEAQAGAEAWLTLGHAFRHGAPGKEVLLTGFVRACVRYQRSTLEHLTDGDVRNTVARARAVRAEAHRYLGLVRFQAVQGEGWYARFEPDHDVLGMLIGHFHRRMAGQDWVLHDLSRQKAWVCRTGVGQGVRGIQVPENWSRDPGEAAIQDLWRTYFRTIAIRDRLNPGLQRSKMPQKTWKHLVEKG